MFNVTKALKKLEEYVKRHTIKEYPHCIVSTDILREILLSGQDDEPETMIATACNELMKRVARIEDRLAILENRYELERLDNAEERISRLESVFLKEWKHNHLKEPSKPTDEECDVVSHRIGEPCQKCDNPLPSKSNRTSDSIDRNYVDGKQEKPVTEENCNCPDAEEPHIHHIPNDDKPSEFISIPRDVAEKYIRYVEAKDAPEAIEYYRSRQDVIDAIKQQLG